MIVLQSLLSAALRLAHRKPLAQPAEGIIDLPERQFMDAEIAALMEVARAPRAQ
jgi:hypothetical protein